VCVSQSKAAHEVRTGRQISACPAGAGCRVQPKRAGQQTIRLRSASARSPLVETAPRNWDLGSACNTPSPLAHGHRRAPAHWRRRRADCNETAQQQQQLCRFGTGHDHLRMNSEYFLPLGCKERNCTVRTRALCAAVAHCTAWGARHELCMHSHKFRTMLWLAAAAADSVVNDGPQTESQQGRARIHTLTCNFSPARCK
jgi:hypothetical protein